LVITRLGHGGGEGGGGGAAAHAASSSRAGTQDQKRPLSREKNRQMTLWREGWFRSFIPEPRDDKNSVLPSALFIS
jgi:hypothetical protein